MSRKLKNEADFVSTFLASTCAVTIGLNLSWPSTRAATPRELNAEMVCLYPAAVYWAQLSGAIVHVTGPRGMLTFGVAASTCAAAIMTAFPSHAFSLSAGRVLQGFGCASLAVALPNYMVDAAKGLYQSAMLCLIEVFTLVGTLISQVLGLLVAREKVNCATTCVISLNVIVLMILRGRRRDYGSRTSSRHGRSKRLSRSCVLRQNETANNPPCLAASREHVVIVIICLVLFAFRDLFGVDVFKTNIRYIVNGFHATILSSQQCTIMLTALQLMFSLLTTFMVEFYGKRKLLLIAGLGMFMSMAALQLVVWNQNKFHHYTPFMVISLLLLYVAFFTQGLGTVIWAVQFEIVNQKVRKFATGVTVSTHFLFLMFVEYMDVDEMNIYSKGSMIPTMFIVLSILELLFVDLFVLDIETKMVRCCDSQV